ncbi:MAG: aldo/keto reductase [Draconibacterium sp.]
MKSKILKQNRRSFLKRSSSALVGIGLVTLGGFSNVGCGKDNVDDENNGNPDEDGNNNNPREGESNVNPFNFETKTVLLNSGYEMPIIGIGTYRLSTTQAEASVYSALKTGMRLIDTADIYGNETGVARGIQRAIQDFGILREEIFVTTKLWTSEFDRADEEINQRLERLELDYIDLLLLHHTAPNDISAYLAMERGVQAGKLRSIGISNFYENDVDRLMNSAAIAPAVLQNETHLYNQSISVKNHIASLGTLLESWYPLGGRGTGIQTLSTHQTVNGIATQHNKTPYQVLLRWHLQSGNIAIPGSTNEAHITEDYAIFDFELTDAEIQTLNTLDRQQRFSTY